MSSYTVANCLLAELHKRGMSHIFGVPGDYILPFADALENFEGIQHVPMADERDAAWAADLVGRKQLSACYATSMVGCLNMLNPICDGTKNLGASALVIIGGEVALADRGKNYILHHELDAPPTPPQENVFQLLLGGEDYAKSITNLSSAENIIKRLIARACEEHCPVYLGLPKDVCNMIAGGFIEPQACESGSEETFYSLLLAKRANDCIESSKRPVILVGQFAERFGLVPLVRRLAQNYGIPIVSTCKGFGACPPDDEYFVGMYAAQASYPPDVQHIVETSDCLIRISAMDCDMTYGLREPQLPESTVNINTASLRVYVEKRCLQFSSLNGIRTFLEGILSASHGDARPPVRSFMSWMYAERDRYFSEFSGCLPIRFSDLAPVVHNELQFHSDTPVVADIGNAMTIPVAARGGYYTSAYGAMGITVGALGIEKVFGKRPLVIVGDGAMGMWSLGSLLSLRRYDSKMIIIVLNNAGWGMLRPVAGNAPYLDLPSGNFEELCKFTEYGLGFRVETPEGLLLALKESFLSDTFSIINVILQKDDMTDTIRKFMSQE